MEHSIDSLPKSRPIAVTPLLHGIVASYPALTRTKYCSLPIQSLHILDKCFYADTCRFYKKAWVRLEWYPHRYSSQFENNYLT